MVWRKCLIFLAWHVRKEPVAILFLTTILSSSLRPWWRWFAEPPGRMRWWNICTILYISNKDLHKDLLLPTWQYPSRKIVLVVLLHLPFALSWKRVRSCLWLTLQLIYTIFISEAKYTPWGMYCSTFWSLGPPCTNTIKYTVSNQGWSKWKNIWSPSLFWQAFLKFFWPRKSGVT